MGEVYSTDTLSVSKSLTGTVYRKRAESTELRRASENVIGCKEMGERVKRRDKGVQTDAWLHAISRISILTANKSPQGL